MTLAEALEALRALRHDEEEAGTEGTAYLDERQLEAIRAAEGVLEDVLHSDLEKYA